MGDLVGRNDPCPCGSGKKFKRCCWAKTRLLLPGEEPPARELLFVFPGPERYAPFALPTLVSAYEMAVGELGRNVRVTWLCRPETVEAVELLAAGLPQIPIVARAFEGNPPGKPTRPNIATGTELDWCHWAPEDWLQLIPAHQAAVNASIHFDDWERWPAEKKPHIAGFIGMGSGIEVQPRDIQLDRQRIANLWPEAPAGCVLFEPVGDPRETAIDAVYARLPRHTIVVRRPGTAGMPIELVLRYGYEGWGYRTLAEIAATVVRARLVVGAPGLLTALAVHLGVPAVMIHWHAMPEHVGITPWGGHDVVNPHGTAALETLYQRLLDDDYVAREEGEVPLVR